MRSNSARASVFRSAETKSLTVSIRTSRNATSCANPSRNSRLRRCSLVEDRPHRCYVSSASQRLPLQPIDDAKDKRREQVCDQENDAPDHQVAVLAGQCWQQVLERLLP